MELSVSSPKQDVLSPYCISDPEEQDLSEEDDDDRNHKHRRQETRSQSFERDGSEQDFSGAHRKNYRHFENGQPYRGHERRRPGSMLVHGAPCDSNQRRPNQTFFGDSGPGRGRGREYGSWNHQRNARFSSVDLSSQMVKVGSMAPSIYGGRGISGVPNMQSAPWLSFGMLTGVPNGGIDTLRPIGLQGALRPPINSSLNMSICRPRCRDFEDRGFCLRGDMCPMEHGINRIVVDDVQSLSQFNLPVSLPSAPLLGASSGSMPIHSVGSSSKFMNTGGANGNNGKPGVTIDNMGLTDTHTSTIGADFYDPDQPLWSSNAGETSAAVTAHNSRGIDESDPLLVNDNNDYVANKRINRSSRGTSEGLLGRTACPKSQINGEEMGEETFLSGCPETRPRDASASISGGKRIIPDIRHENQVRTEKDAMHNARELPQKALRTLYVNGIPRESNRRELLLGHFHKFGKVVNIYIPQSGEKAFVQFSKREEAEAALVAPDAVMGNRFIRLLWANRDNIPDNSISSTPHSATASVPSQFPVAKARKANLQSAASKAHGAHVNEVGSTSNTSKPVVGSGPGVPPLQQKKSEALKQLKEEFRKKQEMLEQKRNEFRMKLAKLEKQASGVKCEEGTEQAAKRLKVEASSDHSKVSPSTPSVSNNATESPHVEAPKDKIKTQNVASPSPKPKNESPFKELKGSKLLTRPRLPMTSPTVKRYKLDNRPTAFMVLPPLPTDLADVSVLREHFAGYGDVSNVELEIDESRDTVTSSESSNGCAARIRFKTRGAAEKAFLNGKCCRGHSLQFAWATLTNKSSGAAAVKGDSSISNVSTPKENSSLGEKSSSIEEPPETVEDKSSVQILENMVPSGPDEPMDAVEVKSSAQMLEHVVSSSPKDPMDAVEVNSSVQVPQNVVSSIPKDPMDSVEVNSSVQIPQNVVSSSPKYPIDAAEVKSSVQILENVVSSSLNEPMDAVEDNSSIHTQENAIPGNKDHSDEPPSEMHKVSGSSDAMETGEEDSHTTVV